MAKWARDVRLIWPTSGKIFKTLAAKCVKTRSDFGISHDIKTQMTRYQFLKIFHYGLDVHFAVWWKHFVSTRLQTPRMLFHDTQQQLLIKIQQTETAGYDKYLPLGQLVSFSVMR